MGGSQNNKEFLWKKVQKRGGVDNQKHIAVKLNGTAYNGIENTYLCSNLSQGTTTKNRKETEHVNSKVSD